MKIKQILTEDMYKNFDYIDKKDVYDSDGFMTEYTWYRRKSDGLNVFVFGDSDIYGPEDEDWDYYTESDRQAKEWFDHYSEDEMLEEATTVDGKPIEGEMDGDHFVDADGVKHPVNDNGDVRSDAEIDECVTIKEDLSVKEKVSLIADLSDAIHAAIEAAVAVRDAVGGRAGMNMNRYMIPQLRSLLEGGEGGGDTVEDLFQEFGGELED